MDPVQLSVDIGSHLLLDFEIRSPESMAGVFIALGETGVLEKSLAERLSRAAGFRNIAVHEYQSIDWNIVYSIVITRWHSMWTRRGKPCGAGARNGGKISMSWRTGPKGKRYASSKC